VVELAENFHGRHRFVYPDSDTLQAKITAVATRIYGAGQVTFADAARKQLQAWNPDYGHFPVCMAKTQMSFSADPSVRGAPSGHTLNVREVRLANGAGFVVAICGDMMTMPGLPAVPAAERIDIDDEGQVSGLF
jgi:formate--tetrahydrofolate ligase